MMKIYLRNDILVGEGRKKEILIREEFIRNVISFC